jgi:integrase
MPLYKPKNSVNWWVRISVAGIKTRKTTGTAVREDAEEFEQRERERLWRLHKLGDRSSVLWRDAAKSWLNETQKRTKEKDKEILAWLDPVIGDEPLSAIDRDALEEIRKMMRDEGLALSTIDRKMALVRSILRKSVDEWRYLDHAPKVPMYKPEQPEPRWLTREEFARLCEELPEHLILAACFAVMTGLRMRAMLSLGWSRIDLKNRRLWVPGANMKGKHAHGIPLTKEAVRVLKDLRKLNPEGDNVFQWNKKPIDDCNTKAYQDALKRAGIEGANWHTLRHTYASWGIQQGVTLQELMGLGGWKSYQTVMRYAHLAPDHLATAAQKVGIIRAQRKRKPKGDQSAKA